MKRIALALGLTLAVLGTSGMPASADGGSVPLPVGVVTPDLAGWLQQQVQEHPERYFPQPGAHADDPSGGAGERPRRLPSD